MRAQVRLFRDLTGHLPHHMDGHQHVHVLPGDGTTTELEHPVTSVVSPFKATGNCEILKGSFIVNFCSKQFYITHILTVFI